MCNLGNTPMATPLDGKGKLVTLEGRLKAASRMPLEKLTSVDGHLIPIYDRGTFQGHKVKVTSVFISQILAKDPLSPTCVFVLKHVNLKTLLEKPVMSQLVPELICPCRS